MMSALDDIKAVAPKGMNMGPRKSPVDQFTDMDGDLTNLEINGDTATGKVGDEPIMFRKYEGRWYLYAEDMGK